MEYHLVWFEEHSNNIEGPSDFQFQITLHYEMS